MNSNTFKSSQRHQNTSKCIQRIHLSATGNVNSASFGNQPENKQIVCLPKCIPCPITFLKNTPGESKPLNSKKQFH